MSLNWSKDSITTLSTSAFTNYLIEAMVEVAPSAVINQDPGGIVHVRASREFAEEKGFMPGFTVHTGPKFYEFAEQGSHEDRLKLMAVELQEKALTIEDIIHITDWERQERRIIARLLPGKFVEAFGANEENRPVMTVPLKGTGLMVTIAMNYPFSDLIFATPKAVSAWGMNKNDLILTGISNLRRELGRKEIKQITAEDFDDKWDPPTPIYYMQGDPSGFESSAILLKEDILEKVAGNVDGNLILSVPVSNLCIFTGDADREALQSMAMVTRVMTQIGTTGVPLEAGLLTYSTALKRVLPYDIDM